jgi:hypothetical protein
MNKIINCVNDFVSNPAAEIAAGLSLYKELGGRDSLLILLCNTANDDFTKRKLNEALEALVSSAPAPVAPKPSIPQPSPPTEPKPAPSATVQLDDAVNLRANLYVQRAKQSNHLVRLVEAAVYKDNLDERVLTINTILDIDKDYVEAKKRVAFIEANGFAPSNHGDVAVIKQPAVLIWNPDLPAHVLRQQLANLRSNISKWKKSYEGMNKAHPQAIDLEAKIKKGLTVKAKLENYFTQMNS